MPTLKQKFLKLAQEKKYKIAIGLLKPTDSIVKSLEKSKKYADIQIIGSKLNGFDYLPADKEDIEEKETDLILSGKVDGLIRGQADTYKFENLLAKKAGYAPGQIAQCMLFEDQFSRSFFTTSGSHSDGWTVKSKMQMIDETIKIIERFQIRPKIGFLTWVRPGSVGKNFFLDQSWEQAEFLIDYYQKKGYEAKNYNIEIETALDDGCNFIVFANGTSGNLIGRIFAFMMENPFYIYFHTGIKENVIENNRTLQDYTNPILAACAFANLKNKKE